MPQPAKTEKPVEDVEIIPAETTNTTPSTEVEVDAQTGNPVERKPQADSSIAEELKKERARNEYMFRQFEKNQRDLTAKLAQFQVPNPQPAVQAEKSGDFDADLHALAQTNYQKAIDIQIERKAKKMFDEQFETKMKERDSQQQKLYSEQSQVQRLEKAKLKVATKYPSLNDETSPEYGEYVRTYNSMLAEDPDLVRNPYAPVLVMHEWESLKETKPKNDEVERLKRVAGGAAPQGRQMNSNQKTVKLTQKELDYCKEKGLSPAIYASMKDANLKEGVSA